MSDPNILEHKPLQQAHIPGGDYSVANVDNRNVAAQAGGAAARAAGDKQRMDGGGGGSVERSNDMDPSVIERIVAEERESQGKLPKYPGLERWTLLEKMGDGAFSNVYRAKEANGRGAEVAIKVVRKFEMNSTQVCHSRLIGRHTFPLSLITLSFVSLTLCRPPNPYGILRLANIIGAIGRQTPSPGLQEATQGCGGAHMPSLH